MRDRRDWMNSASDAILELLSEDIVINVIGMKRTFDYRAEISEHEDAETFGESNVRRKVKPLEKEGYIEQVGEKGTYFRITSKGRQYLQRQDN